MTSNFFKVGAVVAAGPALGRYAKEGDLGVVESVGDALISVYFGGGRPPVICQPCAVTPAVPPGIATPAGALDISTTLAERGTRYGDFPGHAKITQGLKRTMQASPKWDSLTDQQREALEMVAHKIGRILNGDPNYHDSWHDIIGYTKLVADELAEGGAA